MGLEAPTPLFEPYTWAGFPRSLPRYFVRCTEDVVVTPELVDRMLDNMGGAAVVDLDAGHDVAATHPEALARTLDELAAR
jgi:pimeloyl-ACP methyl ester carboxylesterase